MQSNSCERQFVLKLCYRSNPHNHSLFLMGSAMRDGFVSAEHLSATELEQLLMERGPSELVERAEEHLLFCEKCQDAAMAMEIELAAWRRALS